MIKIILAAGAFIVIASGAVFFLLYSPAHTVQIVSNNSLANQSSVVEPKLPVLPEAEPTSTPVKVAGASSKGDIEKTLSLPNPPVVVKAIYSTGWSAGSAKKVGYFLDLIKKTEINGIVIDIKDYSGYVSYYTGIKEIADSGAEGELKILHPNELIKKLHDNNIYVIGRISVFQDPILAAAHPEWALKDKTTGKTWTDRKGLAWMDPSAKEVWDYNVSIAKDAFSRGFDEINFDYVRFASDGDLVNIGYPVWDEKTPKSEVIKKFFKYLRDELAERRISADLFGLSTINRDDLGIGQIIEYAYNYFDFVSPMIYPSHYASGFLGFKNPASYPYEVVKYSMDKALERLIELGNPKIASSSATSTPLPVPAIFEIKSKVRPWLQDFDLGAVYDADMVRKQIQAVDDSFAGDVLSQKYAGWLLWDPANNYTLGALRESE